MKRIAIILIAIVGSFFNLSAAGTDGVDLNVNVADKVIQKIGYDWYAENFQGECEVFLKFKIDENQEIVLDEISSNNELVSKYLTRKLSSFSLPTNGSNNSKLSMKLTFEEE